MKPIIKILRIKIYCLNLFIETGKSKSMKTLIVTASSKSKREETEILYKYPIKTFANSIDGNYKKILLNSRQGIVNALGLDKGPDVGENSIDEMDAKYLPAYIRYSGRTYSKISFEAWQRMIENPEKFDCVILSALYGMMRFDEPIRNYPIKQVDKIPNKSSIKAFWKTQGSEEWLFNYVKNNDIGEVKFVLSTSYSGIINRDQLMVRLDEELDIPSEDKQFKSGGMASMLERGKYINGFLTS